MHIIKPSIKFRTLYSLPPSRVDMIVIHHIAHPSWNVYDTHSFHRNEKGWSGIGYNWFIDKQGRIYEGRGYNQGAHAKNVNSHSYGIALQGNFDNEMPPAKQMESLRELTRKLMQEANVQPHRVVGHRDVGSTSCPGKNFNMSEFRRSLTVQSSTKEEYFKMKMTKAEHRPVITMLEKWTDGDRYKNPLDKETWLEPAKNYELTYGDAIRIMYESDVRGFRNQ